MVIKKNPTEEDTRFQRLRERFKDTDPKDVWALQKLKQTGWAKVPRSLPLVLRAIELIKEWPAVAGPKATQGRRLTVVYLDLWCHQDRENDGIVTLQDVETRAMFSGLTGSRAQSSWKKRIKLLQDLGFIKIFGTGGKPIHSVLLMNPHIVIWQQATALKVAAADRKASAIREEFIEIAKEVLRQADANGGHDRVLLRKISAQFDKATAKPKKGEP